MLHQKLNWTLMLLLVSILIVGLTACGSQSESESPSATTAGEKAAEGTEADTPAETGDAVEGPEEEIEVREATTVMAAAKMIDLQKLPLPDEAELMGDPEPGSLRYRAPIEVAAVVDLYRSALTDQDWQEDVEAGHIDKASTALFFKKEDFNLSLSASDMGEGKTMVSLTNHGNIDLRALPQMADAEDVYYFPSSLGYFSATDVAGVADFTRQELAARGWHEYTRPNTAMANDPERQSFTLIQNGLELSVSVGVAPAQGGKTAVQYSISLLPLDLPVPDDATGLELDKFLLTLSLSYTTPADFETLFEYYSQEMTALGWVVISDLGIMTPERATLFFGNENVPPHTLVLDLVPFEGQTLATLRNYDVDELTELTSPGASSQTEETPQMGSAAGEIPAIPIPAEAADVAYDADLGEITYTTLSDAETVTEFYRQSLPADGWQADEDSVMANDVFVDITFERGEESINISSKDVSVPTRVTVNLRYAPSLTGEGSAEIEANVGDAVEIGDLSFTVTEVTSPEDMAYPPQEGNKFLEIVFTIENRHASDTFDSFYSLWLSIEDSGGWSYGYDELGFTTVGAPGDSYGSHNGSLAPDEQAQGRVIFQVPVDAGELFLVVEAPDLGDNKAFVPLPATEASPMAGSTGRKIPDFLTTPDAQDVVYDADLVEITYTSLSDVETVIEFYRQSLPAEGWQEDETFSTVDENFALVMFNQGEESFNINIFFSGVSDVTVDVSFAPSLVEIIESGVSTGGTATGSGGAPSDSGPLSLVEEEGVAVPSDYDYLSTMETPFAFIVTFASPSDIDTLVELYETELPGQGWNFFEHSLDGEVARLYFENGDQKLSIDLRVNDGEISPELAGQTSVELAIKYPTAAVEAGILPPSGQARIMLMNSAEVELTATVNQQEFKLTPIPLSTEFPKDAPSIDLPPGQYTLTISMPEGSAVSEDFQIGPDQEIAPDEVWAFILDVGMSPMQWPVY